MHNIAGKQAKKLQVCLELQQQENKKAKNLGMYEYECKQENCKIA